MSTINFIRSSLRRLHSSYGDSGTDLLSDQLHWRANEHGCAIAFVLWHYVRTEDNIMQFVLQRKPTIWLDGRWNDKFGLPKTAQGTGMSRDDAQALRLDPKEDFQQYMKDVWQATEAFLAEKDDDFLQQRITVKPRGEMAIEGAIGDMCLTHGFTHLGEIQHIRGLLGLRGMEF